jgi:uncharacterized protein
MSILSVSPTKKRLSLYADFRKDMAQNPINDDLGVRRDEESIREALYNLIMTDRGERLFQPSIGSDIRATLFESNTPATTLLLKEKIKTLINSYEPRIILHDVEVTSDYNDERVFVRIHYYISSRQDIVTVEMFLEKAR